MAAFPPMISPRFRIEGVELQYKPFPSYPTWLVAVGMETLVLLILDAINAAFDGRITTAQETADTAQASANQAFDVGTAAQVTADLAYISGAIAEEQAGIARAEAADAYDRADLAHILLEDLQVEVNDLEDRVTALETP